MAIIVRLTLAVAFILIVSLPWLGGTQVSSPATPGAARRYHEDPTHVWNKLHQVLFVRTDGARRSFGHDEVDALFWPATSRHLVNENSLALEAISAFNRQDETALKSFTPAAKAIMQRDLWAAFDWAANLNANETATIAQARQKLRSPLHAAIRKIALSGDEIRKLPDTYREAVRSKSFPTEFDPLKRTQAFLPADLFDDKGSWLCVGEEGLVPADVHKKLTPIHVDHFSRSVFMIFLRLPGGRSEGEAYLKRLTEFPNKYVSDNGGLALNKNLPDLPPGTQVALLRCAMLVNDEGHLVPTRIVESLQIRVFDRDSTMPEATRMRQSFVEFLLSPISLIAGKPALRAVASDEAGFTFLIRRSSIDPFEEHRDPAFKVQQQSVHHSCMACHHDPGIRGLNTYTRTFGAHEGRWPLLVPTTPEAREKVAVYWKQNRADWGHFRGFFER